MCVPTTTIVIATSNVLLIETITVIVCNSLVFACNIVKETFIVAYSTIRLYYI
jgi:hypothetical protein